MDNISYFDVLFAAIILLSTMCAFYKGMFREIIGLGVIVIGFTLSVLYHGAFAAKLVDWGCSEIVAGLSGFLGIFL